MHDFEPDNCEEDDFHDGDEPLQSSEIPYSPVQDQTQQPVQSKGCSHESSEPRRTSRDVTPWNPQNLAMRSERTHETDRRPLSRNIQSILGEFPVERGSRGKSNNVTAEPKGLQDPLWLIAGLCERGWDSYGSQHNQGKRNNGMPLSHRAPLPTGDAQLLAKWDAQALEEVEKDQGQFFMHGMYGSKCDVAQALDPIHHGLLTEQRASELFRV